MMNPWLIKVTEWLTDLVFERLLPPSTGIEGDGKEISFWAGGPDQKWSYTTQSFPTLYQTVRAPFTRSLSYDLKILFLAQIPSFDVIQTSLYRIKRTFIPPALWWDGNHSIGATGSMGWGRAPGHSRWYGQQALRWIGQLGLRILNIGTSFKDRNPGDKDTMGKLRRK